MAIKRGEIYFVNLNPVQGKEQAGHRPVLVLSVDAILVGETLVTSKDPFKTAKMLVQAGSAKRV